MKNIAKNLLSHIDKDRQTEQLVEKLCQKIKNSQSPIEWRNTAFCLSQMKYSEKIFLKLVEYYETCYKDRLKDCADMREYFLIIVQQVKKFTKPEMKRSVDDFEMKITAAAQSDAVSSKTMSAQQAEQLRRSLLVQAELEGGSARNSIQAN